VELFRHETRKVISHQEYTAQQDRKSHHKVPSISKIMPFNSGGTSLLPLFSGSKGANRRFRLGGPMSSLSMMDDADEGFVGEVAGSVDNDRARIGYLVLVIRVLMRDQIMGLFRRRETTSVLL
jgi:hypothetical protein